MPSRSSGFRPIPPPRVGCRSEASWLPVGISWRPLGDFLTTAQHTYSRQCASARIVVSGQGERLVGSG
eukprot:8175395-Pyramimonas_sp.AAC.1